MEMDTARAASATHCRDLHAAFDFGAFTHLNLFKVSVKSRPLFVVLDHNQVSVSMKSAPSVNYHASLGGHDGGAFWSREI
jgi:hypothetical protein